MNFSHKTLYIFVHVKNQLALQKSFFFYYYTLFIEVRLCKYDSIVFAVDVEHFVETFNPIKNHEIHRNSKDCAWYPLYEASGIQWEDVEI